jgi:hypothetical protein
MYHVTSSRNRASIQEHGLDAFLMGAACGIAGSRDPEVAGCFLCGRTDVDWFADVINSKRIDTQRAETALSARS